MRPSEPRAAASWWTWASRLGPRWVSVALLLAAIIGTLHLGSSPVWSGLLALSAATLTSREGPRRGIVTTIGLWVVAAIPGHIEWGVGLSELGWDRQHLSEWLETGICGAAGVLLGGIAHTRGFPHREIHRGIDQLKTELIVFDPQFRVIDANAPAARAFGRTWRELRGARLQELRGSNESLADALDALVRAGLPAEREVNIAGRVVALRAVGLLSGDGEQRILVEGRDRTELAKAKRELTAARRLESLGNLAGGVAHDFNNMLTTIQTSSTLLREELREGGSVEEALELNRLVEDAGRRAASLTRKLLAFGRKDSASIEEIDLDDLIGGAAELFRRTLGPRIVVQVDLRSAGLVVLASRSALEHALVNLAVNARDAMPTGGRLRLTTREIASAEWSSVADAAPRGVEIGVQDTGIGMDEATRRRVFEPFFTTKRRGEGTGLGLSAVYGTIQTIGGHIHIESSPEEGTTVKLCLPARTPTAVGSEPAQQTQGALLRGTALVVHEEPLVRRALVANLRRLGLRTLEASSGEDALRKMNTEPRPNVVLCDLAMPEVDGVTLLSWSRRRGSHPAFVLMSGAGGERANFDTDVRVIRKPVDPDHLRRAMMGALQPGVPAPSSSELPRLWPDG